MGTRLSFYEDGVKQEMARKPANVALGFKAAENASTGNDVVQQLEVHKWFP